MSEFHNSPAWAKLSADFKTLKCVDCGSDKDIQAGHILAASRFKMARLWKSNLITQCGPCNAKLGTDIWWGWQALKLLLVYGMIKLLTYGINILIFLVLARFIYLDITYNSSTITHQIQADFIEYYHKLEINL